MVSNKQKHAVKFIVTTLRIPFKGNIDDFNDVSNFISQYLEDAKLLNKQLEMIEDWEAYIWHQRGIAAEYQSYIDDLD